ncbi:Protein FAR1-RELATED SEQUENCE 11 [Acorus calamus]|uniref:Protein FAR1-RELATED SEQUENCE n=1 Tax=Acorus calamus TaxID=4465 RepID=A0AAV9DM29_ACOCL|nr:Protein FAR1-RELATED SEQUENCE 11 [Acorus calamus]
MGGGPKIILTNQDPWMTEDNKHVKGLYQIKKFWVPAYLHGYFFCGMTTTGRSESINAFIKRFISSSTLLNQFVRQVDLAVESIVQTQEHDTMHETYRGAILRTLSPLEEQAQNIFTPFAFKKLQCEIGKASQYSILRHDDNEFCLRYFKGKDGLEHTVYWDEGPWEGMEEVKKKKNMRVVEMGMDRRAMGGDDDMEIKNSYVMYAMDH